MARHIERGSVLSQEDYDYLAARCRVEQAIRSWGCTLGEGVGPEGAVRMEAPIVGDLAEMSTASPIPAPDPGSLHSVHPEQVGYIEGTGVEVVEDEDEIPPYDDWEKADLQAEADRRGLSVTGTGKDGNVLKSDLVAALEAHDAEDDEDE